MIKRLIGIRFQALFQAMFSGKRKKGSATGKPAVWKIVLLSFLYLYLAGVFVMLFGAFFGSLSVLLSDPETEWAYFSMFVLLSIALQFIGSVFMTKNQLFDAKDNEFLLSLPIKPYQILASRMAVLLLYDFAFELTVALPAGFFWALSGTATVLGWIAFAITVLALPFFSLAVSCLFAWLIGKIAMRVKNKTAITVVFTLVFLSAYFYFIGNAENAVTYIAAQMTTVSDSLENVLPVYWAGKAVSDGNLLLLFPIAVLYPAPFALMFWILQKGFFKIALSSGKTVKYAKAAGKGEQKTADSALLRREFARLGSSANYILNACLSLPMMVIATVALILKKQDLITVFEGLGLDLPAGNIAAGIGLFAIAFLQSMSCISAPSVSLEGKTIDTLHALPVEGKRFLLAKLKMHWILTVPVTFACAAAFAIAFLPDLPIFLLLLTFPALFAILGGNIGLICGINHPMMEWTNEVVPIKQGIAVLLTMVFISVSALLIVGGGVALYLVNGYLALFAVLAVTLLGVFLTYRRIVTKGAQKWEAL